MALTLDLVARVQRVLEDPGPEPGLYQTDEDYDSAVREILAAHAGGEDAWLFAYGSLIWKPEVEHVEECKGTARGWHRSFCFKVIRFRGTRERPGLMMALDRGGQCGGILYRLSGQTLKAQLGKLFRREFTVKPANTIPRWIRVETVQGSVSAITFVMNRKARAYVGRLAPPDTADILATACGHWGAGAEYLYNTVSRLEARGIQSLALAGACRRQDSFGSRSRSKDGITAARMSTEMQDSSFSRTPSQFRTKHQKHVSRSRCLCRSNPKGR